MWANDRIKLLFSSFLAWSSLTLIHVPPSTGLKWRVVSSFTRCHGESWYWSSIDDGFSSATHTLD